MKKTIAVDLDGVIHAYSRGWADGTMYDEPVPGSHEALKQLIAEGYAIVIVTARLHPQWPDAGEQRRRVEEWLEKNRFIAGEHYHEVTNNKPAALVYIDDRAIHFNDWNQALGDVNTIIQRRRKPGQKTS